MKIFNTQVYGIDESLIASGYPMRVNVSDYDEKDVAQLARGSLSRAKSLGTSSAGSGHDCFLKGIIVQTDICAPVFWWPQWDRYHFQDTISSQSVMHRIKQMNLKECCPGVDYQILSIVEQYVTMYAEGKISLSLLRKQIPSGLELTRRVTFNYLQGKTMYVQRKSHRLEEWSQIFIPWLISLPLFTDLALKE